MPQITLKKLIRLFVFLLPPALLFGSYAVLFKMPVGGNLSLELIYFYAVPLLGAFYFIRKRRVTLSFGRAGWPALFFILLVVYATVSLLWVRDINGSFINAYLYIAEGVGVVLFITAAANDFNDILLLLRALSVCYLAEVAMGLFEIFGGVYLLTQNANALLYKNPYGLNFPYASFFNMNDYASFVVIFTPFVAFQILYDFRNVFGISAATVICGAGIFTVFNANARICYFALPVFAVAFITAMVLRGDMKREVKAIFAVTAVIAVSVAVLTAASVLHFHVLTGEISTIKSTDHSITERGDLMKAALRMSADYGFMGVGVGNSVALVPFYSHESPINLHGLPLQIFAEYGIIIFILYGLVTLYLALQFLKFRGVVKSRKVFACVCFGSVCGFQLSCFASSDAMHLMETWILFALWAAALKVLYSEAGRSFPEKRERMGLKCQNCC